MRREVHVEPETDFTDAELDAFGEFSDAVLAGKNPSIDEYMKRVPGAGPRLRKLLEADLWLHGEVAKLRTRYPGVDLARFLDPGSKRHRRE
jgi:hypothetical protein